MGIWLWEHIQFKTINFDKNSIKWNITNSFCGILSLEITLVWYYQVHCLSFFTKWKKNKKKMKHYMVLDTAHHYDTWNTRKSGTIFGSATNT